MAPGWSRWGSTPPIWSWWWSPTILALLRAAADGARCPGLGTVIAEGWGRCAVWT
ncbi:hypothetical protein P0F65_15975 [Sphingomonas sp. I4]